VSGKAAVEDHRGVLETVVRKNPGAREFLLDESPL